MSAWNPKDDLRRYLQAGRDALLWKLEGLSEYDVRRPLVPTGTNLLGLVKHVGAVEAGYLGATFSRPFPEPIPWDAEDAEPNADMWATPGESREGIVDLYRRVWTHSDATIAALDLETEGRVPWWPPEHSTVTLHRVLIHMIAETAATPDTPTSSASSSTGRPGSGKATTTWPRATPHGGRTTGAGYRRPPRRRPPLSSSSRVPRQSLGVCRGHPAVHTGQPYERRALRSMVRGAKWTFDRRSLSLTPERRSEVAPLSAMPDDARLPSRAPTEDMVWLPMAEPLNPDVCPCGKPTPDGFCEEHAGAVAFKVPVAGDGQVLPAVDWHWAHEQPCPLGESWLIGRPPEGDPVTSRAWACLHPEHRPEQ
jgi:hypothetical protein